MACPACASINCTAQDGGQCPAADRPRAPHMGAGEEGVPSGGSGSELGVGQADEGSLGFYSTRISVSTAIHNMRTDVTTKHDQQTGGTWERRLRKEDGPGWTWARRHGRILFKHADAPAQCQGQWGPTWEAGVQTAEPEGKSFRIGSTWEGSLPAAREPKLGLTPEHSPMGSGCCFHSVTVPGGSVGGRGPGPSGTSVSYNPRTGRLRLGSLRKSRCLPTVSPALWRSIPTWRSWNHVEPWKRGLRGKW